MAEDRIDPQDVEAEVLILDRDELFRESICTLLSTSGLQVTALDTADAAMGSIHERDFSVILLDADTPGPGSGLEVLAEVRRLAPKTRVMMLTRKPDFDFAVGAFRAGAEDVFSKRLDQVDCLREGVLSACGARLEKQQQKRLLQESLNLLEIFLKKLMDASRKAMQAEGRLSEEEFKEFVILVVDDNQSTARGLQEALGGEMGYICVGLPTGGEALDFASQREYQMALVKEDLPDLSGTLVAKTIFNQDQEKIVLQFKDRGEKPGAVTLLEQKGPQVLIPKLSKGTQLIKCIHQLRTGITLKKNERKYLDIFRNDNYMLLKQYVKLKKRIVPMLSGDE